MQHLEEEGKDVTELSPTKLAVEVFSLWFSMVEWGAASLVCPCWWEILKAQLDRDTFAEQTLRNLFLQIKEKQQ